MHGSALQPGKLPGQLGHPVLQLFQRGCQLPHLLVGPLVLVFGVLQHAAELPDFARQPATAATT